MKGVNNPNYKDGHTLIKKNCIDCGKEIDRRADNYCRKCYFKNHHGNKIKGKNHYFFGKIMKPHFVRYEGNWFRSSWEVVYAKYLDKHYIAWTYEPRAFDLDNTTYTPDFHLPKTNTYIEIKGYKSDVFKKKFKLFKQIYPKIKIKILEINQLKKLGVLK